MGYVIATKNGITRKFTDTTWNLLGTSKEGWVETLSQPVSNTAPAKPAEPAKPNTGNKVQKVENVTPAPIASQKVENTSADKPAETAKEILNSPGPEDQNKKSFLETASKLNPGDIKDYFDQLEPRVKYDKAAKKTALLNQLGDVLNWDLKTFNKIFSDGN